MCAIQILRIGLQDKGARTDSIGIKKRHWLLKEGLQLLRINERRSLMNVEWICNRYVMDIKWIWNGYGLDVEWIWSGYEMDKDGIWYAFGMDTEWIWNTDRMGIFIELWREGKISSSRGYKVAIRCSILLLSFALLTSSLPQSPAKLIKLSRTRRSLHYTIDYYNCYYFYLHSLLTTLPLPLPPTSPYPVVELPARCQPLACDYCSELSLSSKFYNCRLT